MNHREVESEVVKLVCFMVASARGLVGEPKTYGPSRFLEAAKRTIVLAEQLGVRNEVQEDVSRQIEERRIATMREGDLQFVSFMDDLTLTLAELFRPD